MPDPKESSGFSERLRSIIDRAGGPSALARKLNMPIGSLNSYLKSSEPTASRAFQIADACSVSCRWLATGEGEIVETIPASDCALLKPEMLDSPVNFPLLLLSIWTYQQDFEGKSKPTLRETLNWIAAPYALHASIKDLNVKFSPLTSKDTDA